MQRTCRPNGYIEKKIHETSRMLIRHTGIDPSTALLLTRNIWYGARRAILDLAGTSRWHGLSFTDKADICTAVVRGLLNRKVLLGFVRGERKGIV